MVAPRGSVPVALCLQGRELVVVLVLALVHRWATIVIGVLTRSTVPTAATSTVVAVTAVSSRRCRLDRGDLLALVLVLLAQPLHQRLSVVQPRLQLHLLTLEHSVDLNSYVRHLLFLLGLFAEFQCPVIDFMNVIVLSEDALLMHR